MKRLTFLLVAACMVLLLLPALGQAKAKPSYDQAIDQLWAQGYPQWIDQHLVTMPGTNHLLGFSWAGTVPDTAKAKWLAAQMRVVGLKNVHLEAVPVDVFDFKSASVTIGGKRMVASTFAGIMPTPRRGLTGQIVYAHEGDVQAFDALEAAGISVKGKLVLVDADPINFWMNFPAGEATLRGAAGVIFTYGPTTAPYWSCAPDALASFDGCYDLSYVPAVYISQQDGDWVRSRLDSAGVGPVANMKLIEKVRLATEGGAGYNVVGDLPGTAKDDSFVLFASHHDVHFKAGTDDAACVANNMAIAKAMVMSGYKPKHTVRFLITTAEEFGYSDAWNDWCIGAWYAITQAHPDWAGRIRAFFNSDYFSGSEPLHMASPDFAPLLEADAKAAGTDLLPYGYSVSSMMSTWQDGWTFGAAGVPTVSIGSVPPGQDNGTYHTQYMLPSQVDWPYVSGIAKFIGHEAVKFNGDALLPYGLSGQADDLAANVDAQALLDAGADTSAVTRLQSDITAFKAASVAYEARAGSIPASHVDAVNDSLRQIEKTAGLALTGMTPYQATDYPHQQRLLDVQCLDGAIAALQVSAPATAMSALIGVDFTYFGTMVSHEVYLQVLHHLDPSYDRVTWGGQANPVWPLFDVMPQIAAISTGTWNTQTINELTAMRDQALGDLDARLGAMSDAVEQMTTQIDALN